MATTRKVTKAPAPQVHVNPFAAATAAPVSKSKTKDKRMVVIKGTSATIETLFHYKNIKDQADARFSEERDALLNEYGIDSFFKGPDGESFIITDGDKSSVMIAPVDKCQVVKTDEDMTRLNKAYGADTVVKSFEFSFADEVLSHPIYGKILMDAVTKAVNEADMPMEMKTKVFNAKPIFAVAKSMPERLRTMYATNPALAQAALSDLKMQFQVKNPNVKNLETPVLSEMLEDAKAKVEAAK